MAADRDRVAIRKLLPWAQAGALAAILLLAIVPVAWVESGPNVCLIRRIFGVECYGCGMVRGLACLLHGDVGRALAYNRGAVMVLSMLAAVVVSGGLPWRRAN